MKCVEKECQGEIDLGNSIPIQVGCSWSEAAYPCMVCGRLHFLRGDEVHKTAAGVSRRGGGGAFLVDGKIVIKE